jgi:DNA (cytosine-5)-methyltransferase 1
MMRFLSVCSGIEAASVAWGPLGWSAVAFSEIEPFPCAVLAHHYPTVPNWGDMTKYEEWPDVAIDLLCGGTPCQSFSVAGLRKGLDDPRGNLMLTFGAIAAKYRPRWLVWENVAGVLSSEGGRDFASLLGLLSGQVIEVPAGGWSNSGIIAGIPDAYGLAYRVLDAQYVRVESHPRAVPQRRRRVFVVGYLGDWRRAAAVLFERESLSWHPAPRREAGKRAAPTLSARTQGGGGLGTDFDCDGGLVQAFGGSNTSGAIDVATARSASASASASASGRLDFESETFLVEPTYTLAIRGRGDSHELEYRTDGTANAVLTPNGGRGGVGVGAIAFDCMASGMNGFGIGEIANPQRVGTNSSGAAHQAVQQGMQVRRLTPLETERLMGLADGYTAVPLRGKPAADGPRYKSHGNSWAVNCPSWIGERIELVESALDPARADSRTHHAVCSQMKRILSPNSRSPNV